MPRKPSKLACKPRRRPVPGRSSWTRAALHPADGPEARQVCAVRRSVIAVTLQAGQHVNNQLVPYVAEPGDEVVEEEKDKPQHEVKDGKVVDYFQKGLFRKVNNQRTKVGLLSPDGKWVFIETRDERAIAR